MRRKVSIVGAGNVGATLAQRITERDHVDVVMVDVAEGVPQGKALDLLEAGPVLGYDTCVTGTNNYDDTAGSDLIIITAGLARKPGMSRDDLLAANGDIVKHCAAETAKRSPKAVMIVVTNPMDVMAFVAMKASGFPKERVIGMGGVLDSARFRTFIALELSVSVENINAFVMGGHGDTMVPLPRYCTVSGVPLPQLLSKEKIEAICEEFSATYIHVLKLGLSLARNEGAKAAKGDFLIFTDADCLMSHSYVEKITSALNKGYILAHGADPSVDGVVHTLPTILSRKWFKPRTYTTGRGIGISRDAFFKIGGYNEDLDPMLGYREDLDLGKRIKENYGSSSIVLLKDAVIATSPRREQTFGFHMWKSRGVRGNRILPY